MNKFLIYIALITLLDLAGSIMAKLWSIKENPWYLAGTVLSFALAGLFFAKSLKFEDLAITNIIWIVLSIIIISIVSYFFFNEDISQVQWFGIFVVTVGMIMVNWK